MFFKSSRHCSNEQETKNVLMSVPPVATISSPAPHAKDCCVVLAAPKESSFWQGNKGSDASKVQSFVVHVARICFCCQLRRLAHNNRQSRAELHVRGSIGRSPDFFLQGGLLNHCLTGLPEVRELPAEDKKTCQLLRPDLHRLGPTFCRGEVYKN